MSDYNHVTVLDRQEGEKELKTNIRGIFMRLILSIGFIFLIRQRFNLVQILFLVLACIVITFINFNTALNLNYTPRITITLVRRKLDVYYPMEDSIDGNASFSIDEIVEAHVVTAEDHKIRQHVINEQWGTFTIRTNVKIRSGPYMYAFFLSNSFPLPDGYQAVDLTLRNGRHVLIETDDAKNLLAALRKNEGSAL